jgi:hypothetical protein
VNWLSHRQRRPIKIMRVFDFWVFHENNPYLRWVLLPLEVKCQQRAKRGFQPPPLNTVGRYGDRVTLNPPVLLEKSQRCNNRSFPSKWFFVINKNYHKLSKWPLLMETYTFLLLDFELLCIDGFNWLTTDDCLMLK